MCDKIRMIFNGRNDMADFLKDYLNSELSRVDIDGNILTVSPAAPRRICALITAYLAQGSRVLFTAGDAVLSEVYSCLPVEVKSCTQYENAGAPAKPLKIKDLTDKEQEDCRRALRDKTNALKDIKQFVDEMYADDVAGESYYSALDFILSSELPLIAFAEPGKIARLTPEKFSGLMQKVELASGYFGKMSDGGDISLCPWFGVNYAAKRGEMLSKYAGIKRAMQNVTGVMESAPGNLTLVNVIAALSDNALEREEMNCLLDLENVPCGYKRLEELINGFNGVYFYGNEQFDMAGSENVPAFEKLAACGVDHSLTYSDIKKICGNSDIFVRGGKYADSLPFDMLLEFNQRITELEAERKDYMRDALAVFDKLDGGNGKTVLKAYEKLRPYLTASRTKPKAFDFSAKSAYKKLRAFSSGSLSFENALNAACSYSAASACGDEINNQKQHICRIFDRELAEPEFESLNIVLEHYRINKLAGLSLSGYLIEVQRAGTLLKRCLQDRSCPGDFSAGDFIKAYKLHLRRKELYRAVQSILDATKIDVKGREMQTLACAFALVMRTAELFGDKNGVIEFLENVRGRDKSFMDDLMFIVNELILFGREYFRGYYTRNPFALTLGDMKRFISCADSVDLLDAALGYSSVKKIKTLPLDKFFAYFEKGEVVAEAEDIPEIFKRSYYKLAVENKLAALGKRRKGLGRHAAVATEKYLQAEDKLIDVFAGAACGTCRMCSVEDVGEYNYEVIIKAPPDVPERETGGADFIKSVTGFLTAHGVDKKRIVKDYKIGGAEVSVAVLSEDLSRPLLYVLCERPSRNAEDFTEKYAVGEGLKKGGAAVHRIFIHDWTDNRKSEQSSLLKALENVK